MSFLSTNTGSRHSEIIINGVRSTLVGLPKSYDDLFGKLPLHGIIENYAGGRYKHFGLLNGILRAIEPMKSRRRRIAIVLHADGFSVNGKNVVYHGWTICGRVVRPAVSEPFIVGMWIGPKLKPSDPNAFLEKTMEEMIDMEASAFIH